MSNHLVIVVENNKVIDQFVFDNEAKAKAKFKKQCKYYGETHSDKWMEAKFEEGFWEDDGIGVNYIWNNL